MSATPIERVVPGPRARDAAPYTVRPPIRTPDRYSSLPGGARVLIVSNRLPVTIDIDDGAPVLRRSAGGLASGLRAPHESSGGLWFGWPGSLDALAAEDARDVRRRLAAERAVPVPLSEQEVGVYYEDISNAVIWPICHDRLDRLPLRPEGWDVYESVNARFADAVAEHWRPGDLIWVHDYHLFRAPALLRERLPEARIGFFLHVPFPSPDIFAALPRRRWLLEGLLGADVIGFHTRRYRAHFEEVLAERCGIETGDDHVLEHEGRRIEVGVFPIGVDADALSKRAGSREVNAKVLELRDPTQRLILGVDRLDYSKGIPRRLLAVEKLLREHPEWRGRLRLVQVAVPSRGGVGAYQRFRREVESLVGRINGEFATPTWTPIHYLCHGVPERMLLGLYRTADVMLVTPVRDGMNLVAKEFAASRIDEDGVLVLSELAGAADELTDALLVNPYDVEAVAQAIHRALTMDGVERRTRMRRLRAQVRGHDIHRWAADFIGALAGPATEL